MTPDGESLATRLERTGPMDPAEVLAVLDLLGAALHTLHAAGRFHGGLRPEALRVAEPLALTVVGPPSAPAADAPLWMAPEQVNPGSVPGPAVDVWSVGLIAFRLLTGRHYWNAANVTPWSLAAVLAERAAPIPESASKRATWMGCADALPPGFDAWFARCVAHDPGQRFPDAAAMTAAARDLAAVPPVPFPPQAEGVPRLEIADPWGAVPDPVPPPRRGSSRGALAVAVAAMLLGLALLAVAGTLHAPPTDLRPTIDARSFATLRLPLAPGTVSTPGTPGTVSTPGTTIQVVAGSPPPTTTVRTPGRPAPPPSKPAYDLPARAASYEPATAAACSRLGDSVCVVQHLAGRVRTQQDLELLALAYQALGQHADAARTMRVYLALFPKAPRVNEFRRYVDRP